MHDTNIDSQYISSGDYVAELEELNGQCEKFTDDVEFNSAVD